MFESSLFMFITHFFFILNLGIEAKIDNFNYSYDGDGTGQEVEENNKKAVNRIHKEHPLNMKKASEEDRYSKMSRRRRNRKDNLDSNDSLGPCQGFAGKKVHILSADTKKGLARCYGCGPGASPDSAGVHGFKGDWFAQWTMEEAGDKCALKADTGKYAGRCNMCWRGGASPDSVFVHVTDKFSPVAGWKIKKFGEGYSFQADSGKYMARCNGCVPGGAKPDFAFVHATEPVAWIIEPV